MHTVRERLGAPSWNVFERKIFFGTVRFLKPIHPSKWPSQCLVLPFPLYEVCDWWRLFGDPFSVDAEGIVTQGSSFQTEGASPV